MNHQPAIINLQSDQGAQGIYVEHLYASQKELFEKIITSKEQEIANLKSIIDNLIKQKKGDG